MIDSIKVLGDGAQITLIICSTIIILSVLVLITGLIYCCLCRNPKNNCHNEQTDNNNTDNPTNPIPSQEDCSRKSQFEKEDRAKALIKDLFEATRVKITDSNNKKEEKCDIEVAKKLIQEYKSILNIKNEGQSN